MKFYRRASVWTAALASILSIETAHAAPVALNTNLQIRLVLNTATGSGNSVRIAKDPRNNQLYYLRFNGDIYQVNLQPGSGSTSNRIYTSANHGISGSAQGMAIGPDGTIYVVGNTTTNSGNNTFARIVKGVPGAGGTRNWSVLATTQAYPRSATAFDHVCNGIIVSLDGQYVYLNSGARTDHGEVQSKGGVFPNTREVALTAKILRLPTSGSNLILTNDINALRQAGYIFAEGVRNTFDLAFAANGDLFGTENGPDRDMSEELNWLRPGLHFGFPWRLGGADNPQQFPGYDPSTDKLLDPRFIAVANGFYHNDPTFPPPPTNFFEPVVNLGPDADSYRDAGDGSIKDASSLGQTLSTFTAHRSPLGLVFDTVGAMAPPFQNHAFMLSFTPGDPTGNSVAGPFKDASQDMLDLNLTKLGNTNYQTTATRIVGGFTTPIDAEIIGNRIYVIEYSGNQGLWEITFPPAVPTVTLSAPSVPVAGTFEFTIAGTPGLSYEILASSNLVNWVTVSNVIPSSSEFQFTDAAASSLSSRFYRVVQR
jgi:glucose/arabinose dehydrogenase